VIFQVSNPSFFAGSDDQYSLPERLPDVIMFADGKSSNEPLNRPDSSMSFVGEDDVQHSPHKVDSTASLAGLEVVKE
jgi:hypothetical protein